MPERAVPLLGDISLELVQRVEHHVDAGFTSTAISGLDGELQQRTGRGSHRIVITGVLAGPDAATQLETLQQAAAAGEELNFAADIVTALELDKVVITGFSAVEGAGEPGRFQYETELAESPPLPPPAVVEGFGGLDDFGFGDLGFDALDGVLGDLADLAGEVAGAVDAAMDVVGQLSALAALASGGVDLNVAGLLRPIEEAVGSVSSIGERLAGATNRLGGLFG